MYREYSGRILEWYIYWSKICPQSKKSNQHRSKQDNKTQVTVWQKTRGLLLDYKVKVTGISGTGKPVPVR